MVLNDRQDYFGQTVNIAARVQGLAASRSILASGSVVEDPQSRAVLRNNGLTPVARNELIRGVTDGVAVYEIP